MARESGNGSLLWPVGVTRIEEVPWDLTVAIEHAYFILRAKENLLREDTPPDWMWPFDEELKIWFAAVDNKKKAERGVEQLEEPEEVYDNEYADRFR